MLFNKEDIIAGEYTVLFAVKESENVESYRVKDQNGKTLFVQIFKDSRLATVYRLCNGKRGLPVYIDEGKATTPDGEKTFVVTKFISSQTLRDHIAQNRIVKPVRALRIARDVIMALRSLECLHAGICTDNILIPFSDDEDESVLLVGLSRVCEDGKVTCGFHDITENNITQAPEYFHGVISEKSEVYAIGALLFEMCFGMKPWDFDFSIIPEPQRVLLLLKAKRKPLAIPELSEHQPNSRIVDIIAKAVEFKPEDRFGSLDEMLQQINDILAEVIADASKPKDVNVKKGNGFKDVAGMDELKERIQREVIDILRDPEGAKEFGISIPNGILLYGPPGSGKTYFGEKMAEEIGCNFMYVSCSDVASPYIHGGQEKIAAIFNEARQKAPTLLFLDEVDSMLMSRTKHHNVSESGEVNEFLTQLNNCGASNVIVVAATNMTEHIDKAALRAGRLETQYYVGLPDVDTLAEIFRIYLSKTKSVVTEFRKAAQMMKGCTPADVKMVVDTAARKAFHSKTAITFEMLEDAIKTLLSKKGNTERKSIGFL